MSTYTFNAYDILNSGLVPSSDAFPSYTTYSTSGFLGRKTTTLSHSHGLCAIHWRNNTFEINGVVVDWARLKSQPGGIFSSTREWRWAQGPAYAVNYKDGQWTAIASGSYIVAVFTPCRTHIFRADEPAVLMFAQGVEGTEAAFLTLVMLYSETRRQERKKRRRRGANNAALSSAGASGGAGGAGGAGVAF